MGLPATGASDLQRPMSGRGDLTDEQWEALKPLLPNHQGGRGRPPDDDRRTINGIRWVLRTGVPWRDMPECYGNWNSVYQQFNRWSKRGVWQKILVALRENADNGAHMIDSSVVRAHQHAAGAKGGNSTSSSVVRAGGSHRRSTQSWIPTGVRYGSR